jgi:hypothetical protein
VLRPHLLYALEKRTLTESNERDEKSAAVERVSTHRDWSTKALAIEIFSIIVGVLLALGLSEWNDERNHKAQAQIALKNVLIEVRSNQELLNVIHENNVITIEIITDEQVAESNKNRNFIPGLQLRETAWETFLTTGMSNYVSYDTILMLSKLYSIQRIYKQTGMQLFESTMNVSAYATALGTEIDNIHYAKQFVGHFKLASTIETELLSAYEKTAEQLDDYD